MLFKEARRTLMRWKFRATRIIETSFKTKEKGITINVVKCYAYINDSNDGDNDQFHERLQSTIEKYPGNNQTIVIENLNSRIGKDNTRYEDIMGQHILEETKEISGRRVNLYALNKMVISDTTVPYRHKHKDTKVSPDHTTENQTDHMCFSEKFRSSMKNVRTKREEFT